MPASPSGKNATVCEENQEGQDNCPICGEGKHSVQKRGLLPRTLSARRVSSDVVAHLILVTAHEDDGL